VIGQDTLSDRILLRFYMKNILGSLC